MSDHHSLMKKGEGCVADAKNTLDDIGSGREEMALKKLSALQIRDGSSLADAAEQDITMSDHHSLVKKGKDCVAVAKNTLNDIGSGRKEMALKKLSALQRDGSSLADAAEQLAKRLEAVDKYYQDKDAEVMREIEGLNRRESELKHQKIGEESQLAAHQNVLQDNQNRLSSEEGRLRDAECKLRKAREEEKNIQIGSTVGGALLGLFTGGISFAVGAAAGAGIGAMINDCRKEVKDAQDAVNRRRNDLASARSAVNESQGRISNVESQIRSLTNQIECLKQQRLQLRKKIDEIRPAIAFVKKSVDFWLLFKQISEHGVDRTALLQKIVTKAAEQGDYQALQSKSSQCIAGTFIEAWEEMETMAESGGPNHSLEIEYRCLQCNIQCTALPYVHDSALVCIECYSKYALKN